MGNVKGLKETLTKLNNLGKDLSPEINAITEANAKEMEAKAKANAPIDTGKLRQSIAAYQDGDLTWTVGANTTGLAPYAPYIEFGTGGFVEVPEELREIAIRFKGRGVRQVNLRPRPYLYPAFVSQRQQFVDDLEDLLDSESKKI